MAFKALLFDLDGTLLNTLEDIANSMNRVLLENKFAVHPVDRYRYFVGDGMRQLIRRSLPEDGVDDEILNQCMESFREVYSRNWHTTTTPYPGIPELLSALAERQIKLAVLSNKPHDFTQLCVNRFFPGCNFDAVYGNRQGVPPKPDSTSAIQIALSLKIPPEQFIFAGDSAVDMKTAAGAGMFPAGVLWGFRSKAELLQNGAKALIGLPNELLSFIDGAIPS